MQSGMAYERGEITVSSSTTVSIPHSLDSDNIIGILSRKTNEYGTGMTLWSVVVPPSIQTVNISAENAKGFTLALEARSTSATRGYVVGTANDSVYVSKPGFKFVSRGKNYPFHGDYEYILIAVDKYVSHGLPYIKRSVSKTGLTFSNPFGTNNGVLALAVGRDPAYKTNSVNGCILYRPSALRNLVPMCFECRTTYTTDYCTPFDAGGSSICNESTIKFGVRNNAYPYADGTYDVLAIHFPPFEVTE